MDSWDDRGKQSCRVWLAEAPVVRGTNMVTGITGALAGDADGDSPGCHRPIPAQGFSGFRVLPETKGASPALAPLFPVCSDFLQPPGDILVQHTGDEGLVGHALP
jgi:hypothetical protein